MCGLCVQKKLKEGVDAIIEGGDPSLPGVDDEERELLKVGSLALACVVTNQWLELRIFIYLLRLCSVSYFVTRIRNIQTFCP